MIRLEMSRNTEVRGIRGYKVLFFVFVLYIGAQEGTR